MFFTQDDYKKIADYLRKISIKDTEFNEANDLHPEDLIPMVINGENKKVTLQTLAKYIEAGDVPIYKLPIASKEVLGGVKIGEGIIINEDGTISVSGEGQPYVLPIAGADTLGGIKIGEGLHINPETGVVSVIGGEGGSGTYISDIEDKTLAMPSAVGGINKGTKINDLEGKSFSQMFDDLLFPTIYPIIVEPSASLSLKSYNRIQEVGANLPNKDLQSPSCNFNVGGSLGSITLNGVKVNNRSEGIDNSKNTLIQSTSASKVIEGNIRYDSTTWFKDGVQPKDNKGNNYKEPFKAQAKSASISINGTYPVYYWKNRTDTNKAALREWRDGNIEYEGIIVDAYDKNILFKTPRVIKELYVWFAVGGAGSYKKIETLPKITNPQSENRWENSNWIITKEVIINNGISRDYFLYRILATQDSNKYKLIF